MKRNRSIGIAIFEHLLKIARSGFVSKVDAITIVKTVFFQKIF